MFLESHQVCNDESRYLQENFSLHNSQTFGNQALWQICRGERKFVEFSVQTGPNRCICSMEKIVLSHDTNITLTKFPPGVCGRTICESEVNIAHTEENSTHYELILLEKKPIESYEDPFTLKMKGFATNNSEIASSLVRTRYGFKQNWMLPTSFNISYNRNVQELNFTLMHVPRNCACFLDSTEPFLDLAVFEARNIKFNLRRECPQLDCFIRVQNNPKKRLIISWEFERSTFHAWLLTIAIDQDIKSFFVPTKYSYSLGRFSTDDHFTLAKTADFIYLHFGTRPENVRTEATVNIDLAWKEACKCPQTEYILDDLPILVSSPYYPSKYCNNMNCSYSIMAADGAKVRILVIALSISDGDRLTYVEHGITNKFKHLGEVLTTESNQFSLRFVSHRSDTSKGFQLKLETYWMNGKPQSHTLTWTLFAVLGTVVIFTVIYVLYDRRSRSDSMAPNSISLYYNSALERVTNLVG